MSPIKFGYVVTEYSAPDAVRIGVMAEEYGFESILMPDHMVDFDACRLDPWVVLSAVGGRTQRVFLCPSVTDVQRCHPAKMVHIASTLDELTGGRAGVGVGAGEVMNLAPYGLDWEKPPRRLERLREAVEVMKTLFTATKTNPANYRGKYFNLNNAWLDQRPVRKPHPPVYVGALGSPKTLESTGELADGWIPFLNTPESYAKRYGYLKAGIARAGRRLEDVDAVTLIFPALVEDPKSKEKARALGKAYLIAEQNTLRTLGFDIPVPREYAYQQTLVADDVLNSIIDASRNVPDELVEKFLPTTVDECIEVVDAFIKAGARHITFRDMDRGAFHAVEAIGKKVLPYFKEP